MRPCLDGVTSDVKAYTAGASSFINLCATMPRCSRHNLYSLRFLTSCSKIDPTSVVTPTEFKTYGVLKRPEFVHHCMLSSLKMHENGFDLYPSFPILNSFLEASGISTHRFSMPTYNKFAAISFLICIRIVLQFVENRWNCVQAVSNVTTFHNTPKINKRKKHQQTVD